MEASQHLEQFGGHMYAGNDLKEENYSRSKKPLKTRKQSIRTCYRK
jgi:hypothetical protein